MISTELFSELLRTYGLLGIFLISLVGNAIPYSTIPYFFFIIVYASKVSDLTTQSLIAILGGLGAAIGKLIVYYIGRTARFVIDEKTRRNMELFTRIASKGLFLAVFLFAALPLPDDVLYVPLGVSGYSIVKFFIALFLGKIIITGMAVYLGQIMRWLIEEPSSLPWYFSTPIMLSITFILTYIVMKIDWVKVAEVTRSEGMIMGFKAILVDVAKLIAGMPRAFYKKLHYWIERKEENAQPVDPSS